MHYTDLVDTLVYLKWPLANGSHQVSISSKWRNICHHCSEPTLRESRKDAEGMQTWNNGVSWRVQNSSFPSITETGCILQRCWECHKPYLMFLQWTNAMPCPHLTSHIVIWVCKKRLLRCMTQTFLCVEKLKPHTEHQNCVRNEQVIPSFAISG